MAEKDSILSTKHATPEGLKQLEALMQGNDLVPEDVGLQALGLWRDARPDNPWSKANLGVLDTVAGKFGYNTEARKLDDTLAQLQAPWRQFIAKTNEEKRGRLMGPTHGQVAEQGLAPQAGVPFQYAPFQQRPGEDILQTQVQQAPGRPTGTMQLSPGETVPQTAVTPTASLDPLQAMKLHAVGQRLGAAPVQPNEAAFKETTRQRLIAGGMDPLVVDKAFASGGFEKEAAPGTDKARLDRAKADQAQDEADLKHYELAYTPEKLLLANQHSSLQNQKLRDELDRAPENADLKKRLAESLMNQRSATTKRLNGLAEAAKKIQMSKEDKLKVDTAIQQWKLWSAFNADTDISKEDMARGEAEILKAAGILTELSQRYPDLVKFMDVGAQHRTLKGVGSPTGARGPATLPPKSQAIYDRIMSQ
jgi:hypothetical protein